MRGLRVGNEKVTGAEGEDQPGVLANRTHSVADIIRVTAANILPVEGNNASQQNRQQQQQQHLKKEKKMDAIENLLGVNARED